MGGSALRQAARWGFAVLSAVVAGARVAESRRTRLLLIPHARHGQIFTRVPPLTGGSLADRRGPTRAAQAASRNKHRTPAAFANNQFRDPITCTNCRPCLPDPRLLKKVEAGPTLDGRRLFLSRSTETNFKPEPTVRS